MADAASTITVSTDGDQLVIDLDGHRVRLDDAERRELALQLLGSPLSTGDPIKIRRRGDHDKPKPNTLRPYQRVETEHSAQRPRPMPKPTPPTLPMPAVIPPPNSQTRTYRGWLITRSAEEQIAENDFDLDEIIDVCENPETVRTNNIPGRLSVSGRGLLIVTPDDDKVVVGVARNLPGVGSSGSAPKAKSGGPGRYTPGTRAELRRLLDDHGFDIDDTGSTHPKIRHRVISHPAITIASSASDHLSLMNMRATIRRIVGIDIFDPPEKKKP